MDRIDHGIIAATLIASGVVTLTGFIGDRFAGTVAVLALGAGLIAANHAIPRRPKLTVEYRNPAFSDRPVVGRSAESGHSSVNVVLRNDGRGTAEAIEVRFGRLGATHIWNESGNGSRDVDQSVHPPRFTSGERVLNPGQEWVIARLSWYHGAEPETSACWEAWAQATPRFSGHAALARADDSPGVGPGS